MFLNQARGRDSGVKQSESRAEYFRSYNQKPHRQEYLKEHGQIRRLVAKYNPLYQDKRKSDRHKLTDQERYRIKILTQELKKRGWNLFSNKSQIKTNFSSLPFLFFSVVVVGKFLPLTPYKYKSFFFIGENSPRQIQESYLFSYLVQKEGKQLRELLAKKPQLFRKKLKTIEQTIQAVNQHWKKKDIISTINQIPQVKNWQLSTYWAEQDLSALLFQHQEAGGQK